MTLSADITAVLDQLKRGVERDMVFFLTEWLPRIKALESLIESKRQTYYETCKNCGYFDGSPCDREDCPLNTD